MTWDEVFKNSAGVPTQEQIQQAFDNMVSRGMEPPVHMVSYERYKKLEYFVGEILKVEPGFLPLDPYSIEIKAHELGITTGSQPAEKK